MLATLLALAVPLAAWAHVKPVRVLAPQLEASFGPLEFRPHAVFCSTQACALKLGFKGQNAYNVGRYAIVIGDRGWRPFFVRHELIHQVQNQRLGSLRMWLLKPVWFREGMAYSLSGDPRRRLPAPLEGYRAEFEAWYQQVGPAKLWQEAGKL